jgi:hypothetical protein
MVFLSEFRFGTAVMNAVLRPADAERGVVVVKLPLHAVQRQAVTAGQAGGQRLQGLMGCGKHRVAGGMRDVALGQDFQLDL